MSSHSNINSLSRYQNAPAQSITSSKSVWPHPLPCDTTTVSSLDENGCPEMRLVACGSDAMNIEELVRRYRAPRPRVNTDNVGFRDADILFAHTEADSIKNEAKEEPVKADELRQQMSERISNVEAVYGNFENAQKAIVAAYLMATHGRSSSNSSFPKKE